LNYLACRKFDAATQKQLRNEVFLPCEFRGVESQLHAVTRPASTSYRKTRRNRAHSVALYESEPARSRTLETRGSLCRCSTLSFFATPVTDLGCNRRAQSRN